MAETSKRSSARGARPAGGCRACGRPILFVATKAGKQMPVDCRPTTVFVHRAGVYQQEQAHIPHFVTCTSKRGR